MPQQKPLIRLQMLQNYIDEFLINEKLLGFVYFRRNEYNLEDVFLIDLETEIPDKWYKMENTYGIEVYTTYTC